MPRNLSAGSDLAIHLAVVLVMIAILSQYNRYLAAISLVMWLALILFARERTKERKKKFQQYCENVVGSFNEMMHHAMTQLPLAIVVINDEGRLEWCNSLMENFTQMSPQQGMEVKEFWDGLLPENFLESKDSKALPLEGKYDVVKSYFHTDPESEKISETKRYFRVRYKRLREKGDYSRLTTLFIQDITPFEELKIEYAKSRTSLLLIQIDNYDEVMQGLNEAEKTSLMLSVNEILEEWMKSLSGFMRRVSSDLFVVVLERRALDKAIAEKFDVLDKVRKLVSKNQLPVTLSMGVAVAEKNSEEQSMTELGELAQAGLDLALGRGGDQVAVNLNEKTQFFGGRAKAVEKHTRVKSRVVSHAMRESMEAADEIFIMGHTREDFDSFGAAVGVSVMAKMLGKPVHIVLSDWQDSIEKITEFFRDKNEYADLFVKADELTVSTSLNPLLFVVDTHIPNLVAAPFLLDRIKQVIVIDHHRRSENFIKNPLMVYLEPASSSTCELVTELLMYFDERVQIGRLNATALYSGIVVDTKNFAVQTGVRTFDAASYLRRSGADPVVVRHLFKSDYETTVALAKTKAQSEYYEGGLVVSFIPNIIPNVQVIAGQAADSLLKIENVRMTIVLFQMKEDTVGVSARSSGELNVQVIMEKFGGGGHQNVAGAQIKGMGLAELKKQIVDFAVKYISETDKKAD